jgi:hypothetical protein
MSCSEQSKDIPIVPEVKASTASTTTSSPTVPDTLHVMEDAIHGRPVLIGEATLTQLMSLREIGDKRAKKILDYCDHATLANAPLLLSGIISVTGLGINHWIELYLNQSIELFFDRDGAHAIYLDPPRVPSGCAMCSKYSSDLDSLMAKKESLGLDMSQLRDELEDVTLSKQSGEQGHEARIHSLRAEYNHALDQKSCELVLTEKRWDEERKGYKSKLSDLRKEVDALARSKDSLQRRLDDERVNMQKQIQEHDQTQGELQQRRLGEIERYHQRQLEELKEGWQEERDHLRGINEAGKQEMEILKTQSNEQKRSAGSKGLQTEHDFHSPEDARSESSCSTEYRLPVINAPQDVRQDERFQERGDDEGLAGRGRTTRKSRGVGDQSSSGSRDRISGHNLGRHGNRDNGRVQDGQRGSSGQRASSNGRYPDVPRGPTNNDRCPSNDRCPDVPRYPPNNEDRQRDYRQGYHQNYPNQPNYHYQQDRGYKEPMWPPHHQESGAQIKLEDLHVSYGFQAGNQRFQLVPLTTETVQKPQSEDKTKSTKRVKSKSPSNSKNSKPKRRDSDDDGGMSDSESDSDSSSDSSSFSGKSRKSSGRHKKSSSPVRRKMPAFSGSSKEDWDNIIFQFKRIAKRHQWDKDEKYDRLFDCLTDKALSYAIKVKAKDYKQLKSHLTQRFRRDAPPTVARREINAYRQNEDESIEDYSQRVLSTTNDAYPDAPEKIVNEIAVEVFLRGLREKRVAEIVLEKSPTNIYLALQSVRQTQANQKTLYGTARSSTRRVSFHEDDDSSMRSVRSVRSNPPPKPTTSTPVAEPTDDSKVVTAVGEYGTAGHPVHWYPMVPMPAFGQQFGHPGQPLVTPGQQFGQQFNTPQGQQFGQPGPQFGLQMQPFSQPPFSRPQFSQPQFNPQLQQSNQQDQRGRDRSPSPSNRNQQNRNWSSSPRRNRSPSPGRTNQCYNCGMEGHFIRECPNPRVNNTAQSGSAPNRDSLNGQGRN